LGPFLFFLFGYLNYSKSCGFIYLKFKQKSNLQILHAPFGLLFLTSSKGPFLDILSEDFLVFDFYIIFNFFFFLSF